ncbi:MAG TPA: hypothetical protein VLC48_06250 [Gemmatimonadota bacterium]|nr:hypothetical protein [Gemmatimonadota bacterium]
MKRFAAVLLAVVLVSCQDAADSPFTAPPSTQPAALINDGAHGGNEFFFFQSPLVETPSYIGIFNGDLDSRIEVCLLEDLGSGFQCSETVVKTFSPSEISVDVTGEIYQVGWKTDEVDPGSPAINPDKFYRLNVYVGAELLGFRDLDPAYPSEDVPDGQKTDPFYTYRLGSNIPVKYTILEGALCGEGVRYCDVCTVHSGDTFCKPDAGLGIQVIEQSDVPAGTKIIITRVACGAANATTGQVNYLTQLDLPQYGGCFNLTTDPVITKELPSGYIVGLCVDTKAKTYLTGTGQLDYINIHRAPTTTSTSIQSLPNVDPGNLVDCSTFTLNLQEQRVPESLRWAYRGLRQLDRWVNPFHAEPVYATHDGFGGKGKEFSSLVWALPSEMDAAPGTQDQVTAAGTALPNDPTVIVVDEAGQPVAGATVTFSTSDGSVACPSGFTCSSVSGGLEVLTNSSGESSVVWTLPGSDGSYTLSASGLGIAVPGDGGSFTEGHGGSGAGTPNPINLPYPPNAVVFNAVACSPGSGFGSATIGDGKYDPSEWECAGPQGTDGQFEANVSGGKAPAQFLWMRDADYLYLSLLIERDGTEKANTITFYIDDDDDGRSAGDDVIDLNALTGVTTDLHDVGCKGQSFCGDDDESQDAQGEFSVVTIDGKTYYAYEIKQLLNNNPEAGTKDIGLNGTLSLWLTVRLGNGNQGNTEWPGYEQYYPVIQ